MGIMKSVAESGSSIKNNTAEYAAVNRKTLIPMESSRMNIEVKKL